MPKSKPIPASESSKMFRFLELPRELRDQVYRERLSLDKVEMHQQSTALLRVNNQVYLEASAIMCDENKWIMVTFNFCGLAIQLSYDFRHTYNITHDVTQKGELPFGREPAARVDVQSRENLVNFDVFSGPSNAYLSRESAQEYLITPLRYAEPLFRSFTRVFAGQEIANFKFTICLSERYEQRQTCSELVMDYLEDIRGVKEAAVSGMSPSASNERLAQLMLAPIQQVDEIITRSAVYQRRGDRASDLGHFEKARKIVLWRLNNLLRTEEVVTARSSDINPANVKKQLLRKKMELVLSYGVLHKRKSLDGFQDHYFDWVLEDTAGLSENEEANAYYKMGLTCKEQASASKEQPDWYCDNEKYQLHERAAYAFLQAYAMHPGWAIVDHELDMLEDIIDGASNYLKKDWHPIDFNLYSILTTFRYKMEEVV